METFNIKRILIPIDFSETSLLALDHAKFMAKLCKADIVLLHVIEKFTFKIDIQSNGNNTSNEKIIGEKLKDLANEIKHETGCKIQTLIKSGRIAKKIVEAAAESKSDLIILGTHGVSGFEEFFMGSNAFRVVTESNCPVVSVQTHSKKVGFTDIFLPIDNSSASRHKVKYAVEIAKIYKSRIHIAGILTLDYKDIRKKFMAKIKQVEEYVSKHGISFTSELIKGENIASMTLQHAEKNKADLIVIMTEQEDELTGLLMGSYAQQVVNHSKIPVMSIKPTLIPEVEMNVFSGI